MDIDETLLDLASVSDSDARVLKVEFGDALLVALNLPRVSSSNFPQKELSRCIVQIVIRTKDVLRENNLETTSQNDASYAPEIAIHPLMLEYLSSSFAAISNYFEGEAAHCAQSEGELSHSHKWLPIRVTSFTAPGIVEAVCDIKPATKDISIDLPVKVRLAEAIKTLPFGSSIRMNIVCIDDELRDYCQKEGSFHETLQSTLSFFLEQRILMAGTTALLPTPEGMAIATIQSIEESTASSIDHTGSVGQVYRIGSSESYNLEMAYCGAMSQSQPMSIPAAVLAWKSECPGYEDLVRTIMQLAAIHGPAAPSGILLTGSSQVGKTHLASCVARSLYQQANPRFDVHWVSAQDLLMQATWADESDLLEMLRPPAPLSNTSHQLLVIDDLQIFVSEESSLQEDAITVNADSEVLVVRNAVLHIIDEMAEKRNTGGLAVAILGIAQSSSNLPPAFVRSGRLEKEVAMLPPSQKQREMILSHLIPTVTAGIEGEPTAQRWAEALSPVTVSCVAGDLCRIMSSAWTAASARSSIEEGRVFRPEMAWEDLRKAAQTYVPIQLDTVDVCKPQFFLTTADCDAVNDWASMHARSWQSFGGYPMVKKRLLRTVVGPWKRFLKDDDNASASLANGLSPPPGVLFHGASGNGKSFAASCLGSSLGLPMIKVRAADVLDKWLGGSEAILRSLFARARAASPCILFFDEIDALATNRTNGDDDGTEVMGRLLSTLLNEMDGISSDKCRHSVLVVACTNKLEDLDAALLRPGRLEEHVHLDYPNAGDIKAILQIHLAGAPISSNVDIGTLAEELEAKNATGADVEGICREACLGVVQRTEGSDVLLLQGDIDRAVSSSRLR
jgi:SpoVK/Ycf46/Vps4 family AAA+-type ATPase